MNNGIGTPVRRKENARLVTDRGALSDDISVRDAPMPATPERVWRALRGS